MKTVDNYQDALDELCETNNENYNTLKERLETEVNNLEQELETKCSTYQLNGEKLEYNYR